MTIGYLVVNQIKLQRDDGLKPRGREQRGGAARAQPAATRASLHRPIGARRALHACQSELYALENKDFNDLLLCAWYCLRLHCKRRQKPL